jgi:hypothetical protein
MARHSQQTSNHRIESWVFPNESVRTGVGGFASTDVGRIAFQQDMSTYWRLDEVSSVGDPTWVQVAGSGGGGGGGGSPSTRSTVTATTGSLAGNAVDSTTNIVTGKTSAALHIATSSPARVRLYSTAAGRTADLARASTTDPSSSVGCLLEVITTASLLSFPLSPAPLLHNGNTPAVTTIYMTVQNLGSTAAITVSVTILPLQ